MEREKKRAFWCWCVLLFHPVLHVPRGCQKDCISSLNGFLLSSIPPALLSTSSRTIHSQPQRAAEGLTHRYGAHTPSSARSALWLWYLTKCSAALSWARLWLEGGWHCHTVATQMIVGCEESRLCLQMMQVPWVIAAVVAVFFCSNKWSVLCAVALILFLCLPLLFQLKAGVKFCTRQTLALFWWTQRSEMGKLDLIWL